MDLEMSSCPHCLRDFVKPVPSLSTVYLVCRGSQEEGADIRWIPKAFLRREDAVAYIEGLPPVRSRRGDLIPWAFDQSREWWENQATYEYIIIEEMDVE
jgi:hypothetical protein